MKDPSSRNCPVAAEAVVANKRGDLFVSDHDKASSG
jgi:hypothetical protein